jgi:hypothetical protein
MQPLFKRALVLSLVGIAVSSAANDRVAMRITPAMALEPAVLTVRTTIEADAENRVLEVVAQSADFYRSSAIDLDGESAPRLNVFQFKNLPMGTYTVTSTVIDSHGKRASAVRQFRVAQAPGGSR